MGKSLAKVEKIDSTLDIRTHRLLAKYEKQNNIRNNKLQNKESPNDENCKLIYGRDNNTYEQLKRGKPNHMESYLKDYNQRYAKKKGLKRLDCYCERKFFKSLEKVLNHVKQNNMSKKGIKKMLFKKYGLPLIIISFIPLFAFILPLMFSDDNHTDTDGVVTCTKLENKPPPQYYTYIHEKCNILPVEYVNCILFILSVLLILLLIFYLFVKIAKYERIKHGY
ncbi:Plasmodium exported protein, unknown function [Plasmodium vivax]|uniref:Variable surface protein Vir35 n=1 Tax=Plasmodium vivax TaxID=5855 RepID=A0A565A5H6_PLAVI|nr:Plasmodium exported protein, unknown function [Plasmodium vivax]